jgi:phosphate-selective porin OprO/OprP
VRALAPRALAALAAALAATSGSVRAAATDPATDADARIEALQQAMTKMQAELDALRAEQQRARLQAQDAPRPTLNGARFGFASSDGRTTLALRALVQADAAHYAQAVAGPLDGDFRRGSVGTSPNRENNGARDLGDGLYFRRARIGVEGVLDRDFGYRLLAELGGAGTEGPARINDAWISYGGFAPLTLQIGAYAPPANMEDSTTPDDTLFIERATPAELSRALGGADGRAALGLRASGRRWMAAATLTGRTVSDAEVFDAQSALLARGGGLVAAGEDFNLHLGANGTWVIHPADAGFDASGARYAVRLRDRPELRVDSTRLIDTGSIDAEHAWSAGLEVGAGWRNFLVQAEDFRYGLQRRNAPTLEDPRFGGWYAQASWVLTGERHRYNPVAGAFQSPRPFIPLARGGGHGAWELALRYSRTDLDFHPGNAGSAPAADGVRGGVQDIWTVGINLYANPNLRWQLNYLHIDVDRLNPRTGAATSAPFGAAAATPPVGAQIGQSLSAWALRTQYGF